MKLNLRQIEVFRAVMITGTIRGASELLFVSQPAVSRLLSHAEQRIGFLLFERIKGRLHATPEAKKLFQQVEVVYQGVKRLHEIAHDLYEHQEGRLNLVASPSLGQMLIPTAIAQYRLSHPMVKFTFHYLNHSALTDRLLKGQADLAITILPLQHPNLHQEKIGSTKMVCICPDTYPLARRETFNVQDLLDHPFISYDRHSPFGHMVQQLFHDHGHSVKSFMEVGSPQNACALVQAGAGIALVDQFSARSWPTGRFVTRPIAGAPTLNAYLIRSLNEPMSQLTQSFIENLKTVVREHTDQDAL